MLLVNLLSCMLTVHHGHSSWTSTLLFLTDTNNDCGQLPIATKKKYFLSGLLAADAWGRLVANLVTLFSNQNTGAKNLLAMTPKMVTTWRVTVWNRRFQWSLWGHCINGVRLYWNTFILRANINPDFTKMAKQLTSDHVGSVWYCPS